jgi:glycosyltransferase involved in cell wall biosynthesis
MDAGQHRLKLILSVDALSPSLSGIGRYTWELASRMQQVPSIEQVRYFRAGRWIDNPESLIKVSASHRKHHFKFPHWLSSIYWRQACRKEIFHAPNYFLPLYAEQGVVTVHDLSVFRFPETHPIERIKQFEKLFFQTLRIATHLITDSEVTRNEVIDYFDWPSERITTVHLGVSSRFAPQSAEDLTPVLSRVGLRYGEYTLCVSTIEPRKRIDALLDAYIRLPFKLRAACPLVLVGGRGWRSESLHKRINSAQCAGWLRYLGFVPEAYLPAIYAGARIFVYPSVYEGFGLPVAEAMASGVPVVTSDRSCLPEVAGGAARLVNPDDIDALTAGLEEGLGDLVWREKAVVWGLQVAARYDWAKCIEKTVAVYAKSQTN